MQPFIYYNIRAVVRYRDVTIGPPVEIQESREILLIPFTEASPPLEIQDFPGEYYPISTRKLKSSRLADAFGEMSISMEEPPPLRITPNGPHASTVGKLQLILRPADGVVGNTKFDIWSWSCAIESHILVKTFYSTLPLHSMPGHCLVDEQSRVQVRSYAKELVPRTINILSWRPHDKQHTELNTSTTTQARSTTPWIMTLDLPVTAPSSFSLLPTFCSTLAARSYALRIHLRIKGLHHETFVLVVPLQVIYCNQIDKARQDTRNHSSPCRQDTREDASDLLGMGTNGMDPVRLEISYRSPPFYLIDGISQQHEICPPDYHRR